MECDKCNKREVCKYSEEYKEVQREMQKVEFAKIFSVDIKCKEFLPIQRQLKGEC